MWKPTHRVPDVDSFRSSGAAEGLTDLAFNVALDGPGREAFRPICDAGVSPPGSTSLKWGSDGELTPQDLHHVLARLLVHDQEACGMVDPYAGAG